MNVCNDVFNKYFQKLMTFQKKNCSKSFTFDLLNNILSNLRQVKTMLYSKQMVRNMLRGKKMYTMLKQNVK